MCTWTSIASSDPGSMLTVSVTGGLRRCVRHRAFDDESAGADAMLVQESMVDTGRRRMKIDARLDTSLSSVADDVRACEEIGFDGAWNTENRADPFLSLTLAAEHSQRIALGPSVAIAFARTPMTTAYPSWDLQRFSEGRLILGLGSQIRP